MDAKNQDNWALIYANGAYTVRGISKLSGFSESNIRHWLFKGVTPRKNNLEKMIEVMNQVQQGGAGVPKHQSHGYITQEQWQELQQLGLGPRRDALLKQIELQQKNKGKTK